MMISQTGNISIFQNGSLRHLEFKIFWHISRQKGQKGQTASLWNGRESRVCALPSPSFKFMPARLLSHIATVQRHDRVCQKRHQSYSRVAKTFCNTCCQSKCWYSAVKGKAAEAFVFHSMNLSSHYWTIVCVIDMPEEIASMEKGDQGTKVNGLAAALQSFAFFFSLRSAVIVFSRTEMLIKWVSSFLTAHQHIIGHSVP